jgi:transcriptional repressor NrdR
MKCPSCGQRESRVLDSRPVDEDSSIKRRRECVACGRRFTTYEVVDTVPIAVVKRSGNREFAKAEVSLRQAVESYYKYDEVKYFCETFLDSFKKTLDELE